MEHWWSKRCFGFLLGCILFSPYPSYSQELIDWRDLENGISWDASDTNDTFFGFAKADFDAKLTSLNGKQVTLSGYLLLLEGKKEVYMLSKFPMASCFFCGNGGPETLAEISFKRKPSFVMDDYLMVTGTLVLNKDDPNRCYYIIKDAGAIKF